MSEKNNTDIPVNKQNQVETVEDGTEANPYLITDLNSLNNMRNHLSGVFRLMNDIDLEKQPFTPIGTYDLPFTGTLDGAGYTIRNLKITTTVQYTGLIGYGKNAEIRNLKLEEAEVNSNQYYAGVLAGYLEGGTTEAVSIRKATVTGSNYTGILVGQQKKGLITECGVQGKVTGSSYVGGLVGRAESGTALQNSYAVGQVNAPGSDAGGLAGYSNETEIKNCYAACKVASNGKGLIGSVYATKVDSSCYDSQVRETGTTDANNIGKLTSAMLKQEAYKGWDFETVWEIEEDQCYPWLRNAESKGASVVAKGITAGTGTEENPYQIASKEGLECIRYELSGCYRLMNDIDLEKQDFTPLGTYALPFTGTLDGAGHTIRNLKITTTTQYTGLIGYGRNAKIRNLKLEEAEVSSNQDYAGVLAGYLEGGKTEAVSIRKATVTGSNYTGILVGQQKKGLITECGVQGSVKGINYVGGLAGIVDSRAVLQNSYAVGQVNAGGSNVGGLAGYSNGTEIKNCYAACKVGSNGKGLIGNVNATTVIGSCYDSQVRETGTTDANNIGKLTSAMLKQEAYKGWDFETVWEIEEDQCYPWLRNAESKGASVVAKGITAGTGTEENPYQITSKEGLECIRYELSGCYRLMNDIDLEKQDFTPLGTYALPFTGTLDGAGHTIRNLKITTTKLYTGLIGYGRNAKIRNLKLEEAEVSSNQDYAGVLAGYLEGGKTEAVSIRKATVTGSYYTGILIGQQKKGLITECGVQGKVTGSGYVGGLVGRAESGTALQNSYAVGQVNAPGSDAGGLAGYSNETEIKNCYAACKVGSNGKGLIGSVNATTVIGSCYDSQVRETGTTDANNIGKLTSAMLKQEAYKGWDFETVWEIEEDQCYPWLRNAESKGASVVAKGITAGTGTEENPYQITSKEGLSCVQYELSGCYHLMNDIDLEKQDFTPLGTYALPFTGTLDGTGHTIRNLKITTTKLYTGLIGYGKNAKIRNLKLEEAEVSSNQDYAGVLAGYLEGGTTEAVSIRKATVTGSYYTGILIGQQKKGLITECGVQGSVKGINYVGGLIGRAENGAVLQNSYAVGQVNAGGSNVGGLAGYSNGTEIKNCYAACKVGSNGKGLIGNVNATTVIGSCYDSQVRETGTTDANNIGKLTSAMLKQEAYKEWDFETVWEIEEDQCYPWLRNAESKGASVVAKGITAGIGTEENPYQITSKEGLECIRYELSGCYRLIQDIDYQETAAVPIGTSSFPFTGTLDGAGHTIRNLKITTTVQYTGLIGYGKNAEIRNLKLEEAEVNSNQNYAGVLAGYLEGGKTEAVSIRKATVTGSDYTGILVGLQKKGLITECGVQGKVTGSGYVGGLVGRAESGTALQNSYAVGQVNAPRSDAGGLAGYSHETEIKNCYAACKVGSNGKGLIGSVNATTVASSCYDSQVRETGTTDANNMGKLTSAMLKQEAYKGWDFETVWEIEEDQCYPWLRNAESKGASVVAKGITAGTGTEENPYQIASKEGLECIRYELSGCYRLIQDIDYQETAAVPIGTSSFPFTGTLDGNGYKVRNFIINISAYAGLFGYAKGATFKDMILDTIQATASGSYVGALVAYMENSTVQNIKQTAISINGGNYAGGLASYAMNGTIIGCSGQTNISVKGSNQVGGLVGAIMDTRSSIKECCVSANVTGNTYLGGIVGIADGSFIDSYAKGSVTSTSNSSNTGGLAGQIRAGSIHHCYAVCTISKNGSGLAVITAANVNNSYFDSEIAGISTPESQAKTTAQLLGHSTFVDWDWETVWLQNQESYPELKKVKMLSQEPFQLIISNLTSHSIDLEWEPIEGVSEYKVWYSGNRIKVTKSIAMIQDLHPETEYTFRVEVVVDKITKVWSKSITVITKRFQFIEGVHSTAKNADSITITWNTVENALYYNVTYNEKTKRTVTNSCTLENLLEEVAYTVTITATLEDGSTVVSIPIIEKTYSIHPETEYAKEFISKCEGQIWFIDEIEHLLNQKGKSISTINSSEDFTAIYAIGLADRGIIGKLPAAIGELKEIRYLFLSNNNISSELPDELSQLKYLIQLDITRTQAES